MEEKKKKQAIPKPIRWPDAEWDFLAVVAKSLGMSRSAFVRNAAMIAAKATAAGLTPYSVAVAKPTPQNTHPNQLFPAIAKQGKGKLGGERSRTHSVPQAISGSILEKLRREGGGDFSTNEADQLAIRQIGPRS